MRLPPELRLPAILALTVAQSGIAAPYFIAEAQNAIGLACAVLCFVGPPLVFWLFMREIGDMERQHKERLGID